MVDLLEQGALLALVTHSRQEWYRTATLVEEAGARSPSSAVNDPWTPWVTRPLISSTRSDGMRSNGTSSGSGNGRRPGCAFGCIHQRTAIWPPESSDAGHVSHAKRRDQRDRARHGGGGGQRQEWRAPPGQAVFGPRQTPVPPALTRPAGGVGAAICAAAGHHRRRIRRR